MCLRKTHPIAKRASKDLYTYKRLNYDMKSPYQWFKYEFGKLYRTKMTSYDGGGGIDTGFHTLYLPTFRWNNTNYFDREKSIIVLCKIPKGASYYIGINEDIVSSQIIIEKVIFTPKCMNPNQDRKGIKTWESLTRQSYEYLKTNYPNNIIK